MGKKKTDEGGDKGKQEAMKDDHDAFTVFIGTRASVLDGQGDADANVKDITVEKLSVSERGWKVDVVKAFGLEEDSRALEAVVSANEELVRLRQEVASLQDVSEGENENEDGADTGEKLAELYEQLQIMGADAAEAQALNILAGLGFTKVMQGRATQSFSVGWRMRISLARGSFYATNFIIIR